MNRRNLIAAAPAALLASLPTPSTAAERRIDPEAIRKMIVDLRTPIGHLTCAENWQREDVADALEQMAGFETPADYKPQLPAWRAEHKARMALLAEKYGPAT